MSLDENDEFIISNSFLSHIVTAPSEKYKKMMLSKTHITELQEVGSNHRLLKYSQGFLLTDYSDICITDKIFKTLGKFKAVNIRCITHYFPSNIETN